MPACYFPDMRHYDIRKFLILLVLVLLCLPSISWGETSPTTVDGLRQAILNDVEKMRTGDPARYQDFMNVAIWVKKQNRKQHPVLSALVSKAITDHVHDNFKYRSAEHRLNFLSLLMGIMKVESGYNPFAKSYANARGLMQVHFPTWGRYFRSQEDAHHLQKNLIVGTGILNLYLARSGNDLRKALLMYLGAPANKPPEQTKEEYNQYVRNVVHSALRFKKHYTAR